MRKMTFMICVLWIVGMCFAVSAFAVDREAIQANVDKVVAEVNEGAEPTSIQANDYDPYVYIIEQDGNVVVHPELTGKNLKEVAQPIYDALMQGTDDGAWVDYEWKGKQKHAYVRKTDGGLMVGSGYTE